MTGSDRHERSSQGEHDNFRAAALTGQAPESHSGPGAEPTAEFERTMLGDSLRVHEADVIGPLYTAGLRSGTTVLLEWLPAIEVAWIDDVDAHEREELRRQFAEDPRTGAAGVALLTEWLFVRPPHEAMVAARRALRHRLDSSDVVSGREMLARIVSRCEAVGRSSGGVFGLGALSLGERARIEGIREALGDEPSLPFNQPMGFPH